MRMRRNTGNNDSKRLESITPPGGNAGGHILSKGQIMSKELERADSIIVQSAAAANLRGKRIAPNTASAYTRATRQLQAGGRAISLRVIGGTR